MSKYRERDTDVEVEIKGMARYLDRASVSIVAFPDGTEYGIPTEDVEASFEQLPNQTVHLVGNFGCAYERTP